MAARRSRRSPLWLARTAPAQHAADLFGRAFVDSDEETLAVAFLAGERLLAMIVIEGAPDSVEMPLRRIFTEGLRLEATALILAHNHPSGDPQPSREDIEASRILASTGDRLGIRLVDHLIFAADRTCSLRGLGLL